MYIIDFSNTHSTLTCLRHFDCVDFACTSSLYTLVITGPGVYLLSIRSKYNIIVDKVNVQKYQYIGSCA